MAVVVSRSSRLLFGRLLQEDGKEFFDLVELPPIEAQPDDVLHEVDGTERLEQIADRYYNDPELQWVIAHANGIDLWPTGVKVSKPLRIPSARYVTQVFLPKARPRTR